MKKLTEGQGNNRDNATDVTTDFFDNMPACPQDTGISREKLNIHGGEYLSQASRDAAHENSALSRGGKGRKMTLVASAVLFAVLMAVSVGIFGLVREERHLPATGEEWGETIGHLLLCAGLPNLKKPLWHKLFLEEETSPRPTQDTTSDERESSQEAGEVGVGETDGMRVVSLDMSLAPLGEFHWEGEDGCVPPALADLTGVLPPRKGSVLIVCSRPYATYSREQDGDAVGWETGGYGVELPEDGSFPREGIVALGILLTERLRISGVDAAFLHPASGTSYVDTYTATKENISAYLEQHPEVGLVVDISRSGELLPDGSLPRSSTEWDGRPTAQLRIGVDVGRGSDASVDYTLAMGVRSLLFRMSPTLSRPVYLRRGEGLISQSGVAFLTLSLGTVGNTYGEAEAILSPVSMAIAAFYAKKQ